MPLGCKPVIVAGRACLVDGFIVGDKVALRISRTSPESTLGFPAFALDDITDDTLRTLDARRDLPGIFTLRKAVTGNELAVAARTHQELAFFTLGAYLAYLFRRWLADGFDGGLLAAITALDKESEPAGFELNIRRVTRRTVELRKVFFKTFISMFQDSFERHVEVVHHLLITILSIGDGIKFAFHLRREVHVENFREALDKNAIDVSAEVGRIEPAFLLLDVGTVLDGPNNARIGRRSSDTERFKFFDKR